MAITGVDATDKGRVAGGGAGSFDEQGAFTGRLVYVADLRGVRRPSSERLAAISQAAA
jgi:hypothetical protein